MYGYFNIKVTKILLGCTSPGSRQFTAKSWSGAQNVQPSFFAMIQTEAEWNIFYHQTSVSLHLGNWDT